MKSVKTDLITLILCYNYAITKNVYYQCPANYILLSCYNLFS